MIRKQHVSGRIGANKVTEDSVSVFKKRNISIIKSSKYVQVDQFLSFFSFVCHEVVVRRSLFIIFIPHRVQVITTPVTMLNNL